MKKLVIAAAVLGAFAGTAQAQSSVTLFGVVDTNITHINASGNPEGSRTFEDNSGINSSRIGVRGTEDLGCGLKAGFWLEAGINSNNGSGSTTSSSLSIGVTVPVAPSSFGGSAPTGATSTTAFHYTFVANGSPAPTFSVGTGLLPAGLSLSSSGLLSGTPTVPGTWTFTVVATNALGSTTSQQVKIVTTAPTAGTGGYNLVASDGGIFSFGDAAFYGSEGGSHLNAPIVGVAPTPDGAGYWLVASDGGVFTFGDATFHGSTGGTHLNAPIIGITATGDGAGYWLGAGDGGVFTFGDATFHGSAVGSLKSVAVGISS